MVSPTNKNRGLFSSRRSAGPCANRRPAESRHHNGSVIIAGARLRHLCAFQRFVLDITVERTAKSAEGALDVAVQTDRAPQSGLPALLRFTGMHERECAPVDRRPTTATFAITPPLRGFTRP